ncbi:MAG: pyridoxal phosphate-dependent aminotransferase [Candidatus Omnitrophica bacterium]|nr:pyridoxal phosphate-dependent aminotransferase [Candidatus Omnitrophota bacterium]
MLTQRIQAVQPSSTLRITALAKQLKAQGKQVVNLAAGEPDFDTPEPIKQAAIRAIQEGFTKYTPTTGLPELKSAIAARLAKDRGVTFKPEQVAVTCGAKQALFNILQVLVQSGDEVLVPSPYWVSYPEMIRLAGAVPVEVRTEPGQGFQLDLERLKRAVTPRTRCMILNSPSNPTGAILREGCLREAARFLLERGLWVISDEIYSRLVYDAGGSPSVAKVEPALSERTVIVDGVSKAYAMTGWRIGYMAGPPEVVEAAGRLQDHSTSNPASISQRAAVAALTMDQAPVDRMVEEFRRRRDFLVERLAKIPRISFFKPEGAFYCFIDISATGLGSTAFVERLLEEAWVALIPGAGFGWDTHVRASFAAGIEELREGLDRLEKFVRAL